MLIVTLSVQVAPTDLQIHSTQTTESPATLYFLSSIQITTDRKTCFSSRFRERTSMSSPKPTQPAVPTSPSVPPSPPQTASGSGVRRYHTISTHGRSARNASRTMISEESGDLSSTGLEDEYLHPEEEWVAPVGAVGEKNASLHRQTSLPTKYHTTKSMHGCFLCI